MIQDALMPDMLLTVKDVAELLSVTPRTVFRWSRQCKLPRPVKLSARAVRWRASAIQAYLDHLTAARAFAVLSDEGANS
jgi:predicted DNA-binding transcriptional regulator AlpA